MYMYPYNNNPISASQVPVGKWSTGLFGCCADCTSCWVTACCPCITFGRTAEILDRGRTSCFSAALVYCILAGLGVVCLYSCTYRAKLRALYSLPKKPCGCGDFCAHCCCTLCAVCQEYRELKIRGVEPSMGWDFNAPKMPGATTMPPSFIPGMTR